ncbi:MAG: hypothetical protein SFT81_02585 [Candidatus Caenarcaniphilales bacterium]|nr:hypothetical protein [Candidatus Caenarcaniphilales bacterium]
MTFLSTLSEKLAAIVLGILVVFTVLKQYVFTRSPKDSAEIDSEVQSELEKPTDFSVQGIIGLSIILPGAFGLIPLAILSFQVLKEYFSLIQTRTADHRGVLWAYLAIPIQYYWVFLGWRWMFFIFIPVYMFLVIPIRLALLNEIKGLLGSLARIQWGLIAFVFALSHLALLLSLPAVREVLGGGKALLLTLWVISLLHNFAMRIPKPANIFVSLLIALGIGYLNCRYLSGINLVIGLTGAIIVPLSIVLGEFVFQKIAISLEVDLSKSIQAGKGGLIGKVAGLTYAAPFYYHFYGYLFY